MRGSDFMKKYFTIILMALILFVVGCTNGEEEIIDDSPLENVTKVLSIGNSFSHNALQYFEVLADDLLDQEELVMGHIHIGGSSLETHVLNALTNSKAYAYDKYVRGEDDRSYPQISVKDALEDEEWDVVVIQQVSGKSGVVSSFSPFLNQLSEYIRDNSKNKNIKIVWHSTWAYQQDSTHEDFANYDNDQLIMYDNIIATAQGTVLANKYINHLIPSGTAIQNLRTSIVGDYLTDDGYHLNKFGKYAASLTWLSYIFGANISDYVIDDSEVSDDFNGAIVEAVTNAIAKPYEVTESVEFPWVEPVRFMDSLHLLAIGNSFTANAFEYLAELMKDAGVEKFVLAYLYVGGTSLQYHYAQANSNTTPYSYRKYTYDKAKSNSIVFEIKENTSFLEGIEDNVWDVITVQQVSQDSGDANQFAHLSPLMTRIQSLNSNPDTIYGYHMTWAYHKNSGHGSYGKYNNDQMTMYNAIISTTQSKVVANNNIDFVIPSGTAIQNARETRIGDDLLTIADGYHLSRLGEYIAGLMWVKQITNYDINKITYAPVGVGVANYRAEVKRVVNDAYLQPFRVQDYSGTIIVDPSVPEEPKEPVVKDPIGYEELEFSYKLGFWHQVSSEMTTDPNDSLVAKFIGTNVISRQDLPLMSKVLIESGYQVRIIYLHEVSGKIVLHSRSDNFSDEELVLSEDLIQDFQYFAFNISAIGLPVINDRIDEVAAKITLMAAIYE